jgi:flagellar protein FlaG
MLIQNVTTNSVPAPSARNGNAGSPVVAAFTPPTGNAPIDLPHRAEPPVAGTQASQPTDAQLQSSVERLNQAMKQSNTNLQFSIDSDSKRMLIRVVDTNTGDTIKQIPSKEVIAISQAIDQFQQGLLLRQKA